ncbi:hypothetical protein EDD18DRAFT_1077591, partial [Armillaria luteobubalina]
KEVGPLARVWRTYLHESGFDAEMPECWKDGPDALLVFVTGLFSAVATTFVF